MKRIFLIVLDSVGIGEAPDAAEFGDVGTNTMRTISKSSYFDIPNLMKLGLGKIDGVNYLRNESEVLGSYARLKEASKGKDTVTGHWEIAGLISKNPMPVFPNGFPQTFIDAYEKRTGRRVLCNQPYSGTEVIKDYGVQHMKDGSLIVYTSADSVFQVAAHEEVVPLEELYRDCEIAREMLSGELAVGRVIARPFIGTPGAFVRTSNRHDYALSPGGVTMLDQIYRAGKTVIGVGKINDIFAGSGITETVRTTDNADGIRKTLDYMEQSFDGLCFVNLVDFDMLYGHRNDIDGYAKALTEFDRQLPKIMEKLKEQDILMITADHGCDPGYTKSTDHSREYIPLLLYGKQIRADVNYGTRNTFADIGASILEYLDIPTEISGKSLWNNS